MYNLPAGEFTFALGININNILYLGASLDIMSITRRQTLYYSEYIAYEGARPDAAAYPYQLQEFRFGQSMQIDGAGIGAKFGFVLRPTKGLRIPPENRPLPPSSFPAMWQKVRRQKPDTSSWIHPPMPTGRLPIAPQSGKTKDPFSSVYPPLSYYSVFLPFFQVSVQHGLQLRTGERRG